LEKLLLVRKAHRLKKAIGLGYVNLPYNKVDSDIAILVRNKELKAKVVKLPFYKN
jgi:aminomethyltransferase